MGSSLVRGEERERKRKRERVGVCGEELVYGVSVETKVNVSICLVRVDVGTGTGKQLLSWARNAPDVNAGEKKEKNLANIRGAIPLGGRHLIGLSQRPPSGIISRESDETSRCKGRISKPCHGMFVYVKTDMMGI